MGSLKSGQKAKFTVGIGLILVIFLLGRLVIASWPSPQLGLTAAGRLQDCPAQPNCVSSSSDSDALFAPIPVDPNAGDPLQPVAAIIQSLPRTQIVKQGDGYLHAVQRSMIFGYPDDIEFYVDNEHNEIHWRSASRIGYSDLGVNRSRMISILKQYKTRKE